MKSSGYIILLGWILIIFQYSCSIEQRLYQPGLSVEWNIRNFNNSKKSYAINKKPFHQNSVQGKVNSLNGRFINSVHKDTLPSTLNPVSIDERKYPIRRMADTCDLMKMKDGKEISAKILEVTQDLIKYKKCENLDGPVYSTAKSGVIWVKYANGTADYFEVEDTTSDIRPVPGEKQASVPSGKLVEGNGALGLFMGFLGIIFIGLAFVVANTDGAIFLLLAGLILSIVAMVLGIIGMIRVLTGKKKYKGLGNAILAQIIGFLTFLFLFLLVG